MNVRISSSNTTRVLVSPNTTTAGSSFIDLFIPDGDTYKDFYLQGINGVTGGVTITATCTGFSDGTMDVTVVEPVLDIYNIDTSPSASADDDPFQVQIGLQNAGGTNIQEWQNVSPAAPIQVLITSSNTGAGELKTAAEQGASVAVEIPENTYRSAASVVQGGVAFDPVAQGTTLIHATSSGFDNSFAGSSETVNVGP